MSLSSWKEIYYPVDADKVKRKDAVAHSLQKWRGLRKENLASHGVDANQGLFHPYLFDGEEGRLLINSDTCSLCQLYLLVDDSCDQCPIYKSTGSECFEANSETDTSAYGIYCTESNPEPMISVLELAEKWEREQK